jgi:hypothetical protein
MNLEKLKNVFGRGYVVLPSSTQFVQSLMEFFEVNKGIADICMVYNGTSCGLNDMLWEANFWLPMSAATARVIGVGYYSLCILIVGGIFLRRRSFD